MPEPLLSNATIRAIEAADRGSFVPRVRDRCEICGATADVIFEDPAGRDALCDECVNGLALLVLRRLKTGEARIEAPPARGAGERMLFEVQPAHQDPA